MATSTTRRRVTRLIQAIVAAVSGPGMHGFTCGPPPKFVIARPAPSAAAQHMFAEALDPQVCESLCGTRVSECRYAYDCTNATADGGTCEQRQFSPPPNAPPLVLCTYFGPNYGAGRACPGLREPVTSATTEPGAYFARMAWLEAASVHAFRTLARELDAHGAPRALSCATRRAARDEVRHARVTRALARRHGARPARVRPPAARPVRSIAAIAVDNAVEGCVREAFGAVVLAWQARFAADPRVRRELSRIADDEAGHAALAWQIARFVEPKLSPTDRARVARARREAIDELARDSDPTRLALLDASREWLAGGNRSDTLGPCASSSSARTTKTTSRSAT